jgi:hypothetical protein
VTQQDLFLRMTKISERYAVLKEIFDRFAQFATSQLTKDNYPVKGISFSPRLNKNYFDVSFAGKRVRFSFSIAEDTTGAFQGFVACNPVGQDGKPVDKIIGEFSFNRQAETAFKTTDGDPLYVDSEREAAYVVLRFLNDAFDKK